MFSINEPLAKDHHSLKISSGWPLGGLLSKEGPLPIPRHMNSFITKAIYFFFTENANAQPTTVLSFPVDSSPTIIPRLVDWIWTCNAQSTVKVTSGQNTNHQITSQSQIHCAYHVTLPWRWLAGKEVAWTWGTDYYGKIPGIHNKLCIWPPFNQVMFLNHAQHF